MRPARASCGRAAAPALHAALRHCSPATLAGWVGDSGLEPTGKGLGRRRPGTGSMSRAPRRQTQPRQAAPVRALREGRASGRAARAADPSPRAADRLPDCPSRSCRGRPGRAGPFITERASAGFGVHVTGSESGGSSACRSSCMPRNSRRSRPHRAQYRHRRSVFFPGSSCDT